MKGSRSGLIAPLSASNDKSNFVFISTGRGSK
jgi:hypothetical protein